MSKLTELIQTRGYLRSRVTRSHNTIANSISSLTILECNEHLDSMKRLSVKLTNYDLDVGSIVSGMGIQADLDSEIAGAEEYETKISASIRFLNERLSDFNDDNQNSPRSFFRFTKLGTKYPIEITGNSFTRVP